MNKSLLVLLIVLVSLVTVVKCLWMNEASVSSSKQATCPSLIETHSPDITSVPSGMHHHGTYNGIESEVERIADLSDKGSSWDKKLSRVSHFRFYKTPPRFSALRLYSAELLHSSHLVPATITRV